MAPRTFILAAVLLLAACGSQPSREDTFMTELSGMLAGSYDNLAQSRAAADHVSLRLVIAPVQAALFGKNVFYVQEMAGDDARRVLSQKLYILSGVEGEPRAVLAQADFAEPARWRDGHLNRDLFKSLLPADIRPRAGCDLLVVREGTGFRASGGTSCRISAPGTGETLRVEQRIELDADGLAVLERQRDAAGVLVSGDAADPWYRFARRADAPW